jgi:inner membrane protein
MEWSLTHLWLILALILGLAELASGVLVLLALDIAAALTAILAFVGVSFEWQLAGMGVLSGLLVPVAIIWIKPRFSPKGVSYGTTGTGVERGTVYRTIKRDFDNATGIKVNGDFYRLRISDTGETELPADTRVIFETFDGTTAVVSLEHHLDHQKEQ